MQMDYENDAKSGKNTLPYAQHMCPNNYLPLQSKYLHSKDTKKIKSLSLTFFTILAFLNQWSACIILIFLKDMKSSSQKKIIEI